jgi:hypothetical protein
VSLHIEKRAGKKQDSCDDMPESPETAMEFGADQPCANPRAALPYTLFSDKS